MPPTIHFHSTTTIFHRLLSPTGSHKKKNRRCFMFALLILACLLYIFTFKNNKNGAYLSFKDAAGSAGPDDPFQLLQSASSSDVLNTVQQRIVPKLEEIRFLRYPFLNPCTNHSSGGKKASNAIIVYVLSGHQHDAHHRLRIRESWGRKLFQLGIPVIFPLAPFRPHLADADQQYAADLRVLNISLESESALFDDILQAEPVPFEPYSVVGPQNDLIESQRGLSFASQRAAVARFERDRTRACPGEYRAVLILDRLSKLYPENLLGFMSAHHVFDHHRTFNTPRIICDSYFSGRYCADTGIIILPSNSSNQEDSFSTLQLIQERVVVRGQLGFYRLAASSIKRAATDVKSTGSICFTLPSIPSVQKSSEGASGTQRKYDGSVTFCDSELGSDPDRKDGSGKRIILLSKEFDFPE